MFTAFAKIKILLFAALPSRDNQYIWKCITDERQGLRLVWGQSCFLLWLAFTVSIPLLLLNQLRTLINLKSPLGTGTILQMSDSSFFPIVFCVALETIPNVSFPFLLSTADPLCMHVQHYHQTFLTSLIYNFLECILQKLEIQITNFTQLQ